MSHLPLFHCGLSLMTHLFSNTPPCMHAVCSVMDCSDWSPLSHSRIPIGRTNPQIFSDQAGALLAYLKAIHKVPFPKVEAWCFGFPPTRKILFRSAASKKRERAHSGAFFFVPRAQQASASRIPGKPSWNRSAGWSAKRRRDGARRLERPFLLKERVWLGISFAHMASAFVAHVGDECRPRRSSLTSMPSRRRSRRR